MTISYNRQANPNFYKARNNNFLLNSLLTKFSISSRLSRMKFFQLITKSKIKVSSVMHVNYAITAILQLQLYYNYNYITIIAILQL